MRQPWVFLVLALAAVSITLAVILILGSGKFLNRDDAVSASPTPDTSLTRGSETGTPIAPTAQSTAEVERLPTATPALVASPTLGVSEGWIIRDFNAFIDVQTNGTVLITEDIVVDFGSLQRHGIFRDIPQTLTGSAGLNRISIEVRSVTDGTVARPYTLQQIAGYQEIKIGDPDVLISGEQRYVITYAVDNALTSNDHWDEFQWYVTGNDWGVPIQSASVVVAAPAIERAECYEGLVGSTESCERADGATPAFRSTHVLPTGSGLVLTLALTKGSVEVAPSLPPSNDLRVQGVLTGHLSAGAYVSPEGSFAVVIPNLVGGKVRDEVAAGFGEQVIFTDDFGFFYRMVSIQNPNGNLSPDGILAAFPAASDVQYLQTINGREVRFIFVEKEGSELTRMTPRVEDGVTKMEVTSPDLLTANAVFAHGHRVFHVFAGISLVNEAQDRDSVAQTAKERLDHFLAGLVIQPE